MKKDGIKILGIKKVTSQKSGKVFTTYYGTKSFSDYETENSDLLVGLAVEEVGTSEDFPIEIGDTVKFFYGKAIGSYQPVIDFQMIEKHK